MSKVSLSVKSQKTKYSLGFNVHLISLLKAYSCVAANEWFFNEGNDSVKQQ
jgi:hypothetical protein